MTAEEKKDVMINCTIEEWVEIYSEAVIELYKKLLDYACVAYNSEEKKYTYFWRLVNAVYYLQGKPVGHDLDQLIELKIDKKEILQILETDYKEICLIFKQRYSEVIKNSFENELNVNAKKINTLSDENDRIAFEKLLKNHGDKVFKNVSDLAYDGDISAQVLLGKLYFLGWGTRVKTEEGIIWFEKAAESQNGAALFYAGRGHENTMCFETGVCLNSKSCDYYHEALAAGYTEASYALYRYYKRYVSGKTGQFRAKKWLNKGLEMGSIYCHYEIAERTDEHWATNNVKTVVDWIKAAAHFG
ncbi:MAG: hypothetical protein RR604_05515, partial [Eubacterium sp.]